MMRKEEERVAEDYKATLSELNSTSKPEINALTMLAEENKQSAVSIAACIENHLKSVPNKQKLPVLYLIDSICKNYPSSIYVQLFTQNLVSNFCKVFEVSDEKVRKSLHKLRMTWNTTNIFPQKKLNAIDERVHKMDPNWPVLHKITQQQQQHQQQQEHQQHQQKQHQHQSQQQQQHHARQQHLQQQQHQAQQQHLQQQQHFQQQQQLLLLPQLHMQPGPMHPQPQELLIPPQELLIPPQELLIPPQPLLLPSQPLLIPPQPLLIPPQQIPQQLIQQQHQQQQHQQQQQQQHQQQQQQQQQQEQQQQQQDEDNHTNRVKSLYGGKQCSNCSLRFDDDEKYSHHLDWHFRQNLKSDTIFARRKWYYPLDLWVKFREINDDENQDNNNTDSNMNELQIPINDYEVPTAPASKDDEKNICSVCHESFEKFWAEEEEEWRLKNARLYEDQRVYHPLCLKDYAAN